MDFALACAAQAVVAIGVADLSQALFVDIAVFALAVVVVVAALFFRALVDVAVAAYD